MKLKTLISKYRKNRPSYWENAESNISKLNLRQDNSVLTAYIKFAELFKKNNVQLSACMTLHSLAADKLKTYQDIVNSVDGIKAYDGSRIFFPRTVRSRDFNKSQLEKFIFYTIYLFKNSPFHIVAKPRFGGLGEGIEFIKKEQNGTYTVKKTFHKTVKTSHFSSDSDMVNHIRSLNKYVVQNYAPVDMKDGMFDIRVLWAGPTTMPIYYTRINKNRGAVVPNLSQGGMPKLGAPKDLDELTLFFTDRLRKIFEMKLKKDSFYDRDMLSGDLFSKPLLESFFETQSLLLGFDISFARTRSNAAGLGVYTKYIPQHTAQTLLNDLFTKKLENWRLAGVDGKLCIFYEINSNPGLKGPVTIKDGELIKKLCKSLAEELRRLGEVK